MATRVYSVNPLTSPEVKWGISTYNTTPVLLEQTGHIVYMLGGVVEAIDIFTGGDAWFYDTGAVEGAIYIAGVLSDGRTIIVCTEDRVIALRDAGSYADVVWVHQLPLYISTGPVIGDDEIYYTYQQEGVWDRNRVVKLSSLGSVVFDIEVVTTSGGSGFYLNGYYYFGTTYYNCVSSSGSIVFTDRSFIHQGDFNGILIGTDGMYLYAQSTYFDDTGNRHTRLYKLDSGLNTLWEYSIPEPSGSLIICAYTDKIVFAAEYTPKIRVVNSSGTLSEEFVIPYSVSSPALAGVNGALYVGVPGRVVCYALPGFSEVFNITCSEIDQGGVFLPHSTLPYLFYSYNWNYYGIVCLSGATLNLATTLCTSILTDAYTSAAIIPLRR
jgi:hypothetical protein